MGFFRKKKQEKPAEKNTVKDDALKEDISKAYDEIMSNGTDADKQEETSSAAQNNDFENELFKTRVKIFKEKKTQETLNEVIKLLPGRKFLVPSVSNMKEPFENIDGKIKLKQGAVFNPALLTGTDKKVFLPIFTDEEAMVQKSPSGVILRFSIEQCVGIVYNKKNPVAAIAVNPFTENMVIGEDLLRMVFQEKTKEN